MAQWWCKFCLETTDQPAAQCPRCGAQGTLLQTAGEVVHRPRGRWECCVCYQPCPSFLERCPTCGAIGSIDVRREREHNHRWTKLIADRKIAGVRVWAQSSSFKALDPLLLGGFCRAFCVYWVVKRKAGEDFWAWLERVEGRAAIINLQVAYQARQPASRWYEKSIEKLKAADLKLWQRAAPSGGEPGDYPAIPAEVVVPYRLTPHAVESDEDGSNRKVICLEPIDATYRGPSALTVGPTGEVAVAGASSYRNVLRAVELKRKARRAQREERLAGDIEAHDEAIEKAAQDLREGDLNWLTDTLQKYDVKYLGMTRANSRSEAAPLMLGESGELKLISLKGGGGGHSIAVHNLGDRVVYLDPNEGEYTVPADAFGPFLKIMLPKRYSAFFVLRLG